MKGGPAAQPRIVKSKERDIRSIRVLYLGMYWDYGDPARGTSFEENSFHAGLKAHPNVEVTHFDHVALESELGRPAMNARLAETVRDGDFDVLFCVMFTDQLEPETIKSISEESRTVTIAWGCDDHWRFDDYSRHWGPLFNWWVTTAQSAPSRFRSIGCENVIKSQWAVEPTVYYPIDVPRDIEVSFVGMPHGIRPQVMQWLYQQGIAVHVFGFGWAGINSRVTHEQMVEIFSRSRVCLNLSNSSTMEGQQIKGRVFEVPGCRSFLLTDTADDLVSYYEPGKEIVVYGSPQDLVEKIRYYVAHDEEREKIARAGYERTMHEHTWKHRFDAIFRVAGLQ